MDPSTLLLGTDTGLPLHGSTQAAPPAGPPPVVYGPFPTQNMIEWTEAGFFSSNPCFVRQLGEAEWDDITELDFSLFP